MTDNLIVRLIEEELSWANDGIEYHLEKTKHLEKQYDDPDLNHYIGRKDCAENLLKEIERRGLSRD